MHWRRVLFAILFYFIEFSLVSTLRCKIKAVCRILNNFFFGSGLDFSDHSGSGSKSNFLTQDKYKNKKFNELFRSILYWNCSIATGTIFTNFSIDKKFTFSQIVVLYHFEHKLILFLGIKFNLDRIF